MSLLGVVLTGVLELQWVARGDWTEGDNINLETALLGVLLGVLKMLARWGDWSFTLGLSLDGVFRMDLALIPDLGVGG